MTKKKIRDCTLQELKKYVEHNGKFDEVSMFINGMLGFARQYWQVNNNAWYIVFKQIKNYFSQEWLNKEIEVINND